MKISQSARLRSLRIVLAAGLGLLALILVSLSVQASPTAVSLATWLPGNSETAVSPTGTAANVVGGDMSRTGIAYNAGGDFNSKSWPAGTTLDTGFYVEWSVAPAGGYKLDLTTMDIRYDRSSTGPSDIEIRVSTDGFATHTVVHVDSSVSTGSENNPGIDLSAVPTVSDGETAVFRLYGYNAGSGSGTFDIEDTSSFDGSNGLVVYGDVSVDNGGVDTAPAVTTVDPADSSTGVGVSSDVDVTFSEVVTVSAATFDLSCPSGSPITFTLSPAVPGPAGGYTLTPNSYLPANTTCELTVTAAAVTDTDGTPDNMTADFTSTFTTEDPLAACATPVTGIHDIQGTTDTPNNIGATVNVRGLVVATSSNLSGFYMQDVTPDADPVTSEGIFVYMDTAYGTPAVSMGDEVCVTGAIDDFFGQTQLDNGNADLAVTVIGGGNPLSYTAVTMPAPSADYLERFEGMAVTFAQEMNVTNHYELGRGNVLELSANSRLYQPTHVAEPGTAANNQQTANNLNRIRLDDLSNAQNPTPVTFPPPSLTFTNTVRGGDVVTGVQGVLGYSWNGWGGTDGYRIRVTTPPTVVSANPRPADPPAVGGSLTVASFNVLNYYDTFTGCFNGCRGADNATEFDRQRTKIITAIVQMDADIIGLMELENDGYADEASAIDDLVDGLNEATAPGTYAYVDVDAETGQTQALGTDSIKVGMIYQPATVAMTGTTRVLDYADGRNRVTLVQSFAENATGEVVTIAVNHFKSKGSCPATDPGLDPDADQGDGQGCWNATRTAAANSLVTFLAGDPTSVGDNRHLIIGDLNAYAKEDPIDAVKAGSGALTFTDLVAATYGDSAYGYSFDGQWGYLDYAMGSNTIITHVTGVGDWHINADEPIYLDYNTEFKDTSYLDDLYGPAAYRSSDHDPVLIGLNLADDALSAPVMNPAALSGADTVLSWQADLFSQYNIYGSENAYLLPGQAGSILLNTQATTGYTHDPLTAAYFYYVTGLTNTGNESPVGIHQGIFSFGITPGD